MFWSGNFMAVRELSFLLKEENVTLASVLEADDILQECKADNKALIQFLTRPDILAELISLITEEPSKNVELSQQYRHASIACEVLTSHLSTLSDRLTLDTTQMNRLCDFINKDPPLNPLLASYFSKTVEMLLERSPKQDWYLYHIVCLRVLDFFKSRRDFLPNLLRHISTSAIADTFKYLVRLDDLFNKPIMEWLEQHQFLDSLVSIICGSYVPEHLTPPERPDQPEKGAREPSEKDHANDNTPLDNAECSQSSRESPNRNSVPAEAGAAAGAGAAAERAELLERVSGVAAANAAALLCDLVATGCAGEGAPTRSRTAWQLGAALGGSASVRAVLGGVFTCPGRRRAAALHHAARLLTALLYNHTSENEEERSGVELAVAPHLPLLHQALLHDPAYYTQEESGVCSGGDGSGAGGTLGARVGAARVSTAALLAALALSEVEEVASTLLTLGTPGVLVELMFSFPENNFLHAQVLAFCRNVLANRLYRLQYARHLFYECDLLTRLMDAFEENEHKLNGSPRAGYMGHVVVLLGCCGAALAELGAGGAPDPALARYQAFRDQRLAPVLLRHDTPLGGSYPSDNMYDTGDELENPDTMAASYDDFGNTEAVQKMDDYYRDQMSNEVEPGGSAHDDSPQFVADGLGLDADEKRTKAQNSFLELAGQRFDDDMWDDAPDADAFCAATGAAGGADADPAWVVPAWESAEADEGAGWAQFDAFAAPPPAFAAAPPADPFTPFWDANQPEDGGAGLSRGLGALALSAGGTGGALASHLLTAMSGMTPAAIANLVNANLDPLPLPAPPELHDNSDDVQGSLPCEAADLPTPNPVTPPAEFGNSPQFLPSEPAPGDSPAQVASPGATPDDAPSEAPGSSHPQEEPVELNCVTPVKDTPMESSSSADNVCVTNVKVNDLSPPDKDSSEIGKAETVIDNAVEAPESAAEAAEDSAR